MRITKTLVDALSFASRTSRKFTAHGYHVLQSERFVGLPDDHLRPCIRSLLHTTQLRTLVLAVQTRKATGGHGTVVAYWMTNSMPVGAIQAQSHR